MTNKTRITLAAALIIFAILIGWNEMFSCTTWLSPKGSTQFDWKNGIPQIMYDNLNRWELIANSLRILQVTLGVIGTAAALIVTTFTTELEPRKTKACTLIAAFCIGTITAFDIGGKANQSRNAWRELTVAILKHKNTEQTKESRDILIMAYKRAEEIVGDVGFQVQPGETPNPTQTIKDKNAEDTKSGAGQYFPPRPD